MAPEKQTILDFTEARDVGVAVASAGPYANHLHHTPVDQYPIARFLWAGCRLTSLMT